MDKIKKANEILQKGEPNNWSRDHKGYAGYTPQSVIDAVNEAEIEYSLELLEVKERETNREDKNKRKIVDAFVKLRVTIGERKVDAVASHPILDDYGDAVKSAQSDAMKKAFAHFSIGNRAYHGLLTEDKPSDRKPDSNFARERAEKDILSANNLDVLQDIEEKIQKSKILTAKDKEELGFLANERREQFDPTL